MRSCYSELSLFFCYKRKGYPLVDFVDLDLFLDGLFGQLFIFLDLIFLFLQLLTKQLDTVLHRLHVLALSFDFVLLVNNRQIWTYALGLAHL